MASRMFNSSKHGHAQYRLNAERAGHATVAIDDSLYLWCGLQPDLPAVHDNPEKKRLASTLKIFSLSSGKWASHVTKGTPPLGVHGYACGAVADKLYYFGGDCGHFNCYHNSVNQLDTNSLTWTELEPTANDRPVMRRADGGMITIESDGVHKLLMIGGVGSPPSTQLPQADYIEVSIGKWRTNEHSVYNLSTGEWSNPSITGQCIPPANGFVTEKINNSRAIVFGGWLDKGTVSNTVYLMEISGTSVCWQSLKKPDAIDQWPIGRYVHAATIITGSVSPILVTMGGWDQNAHTLNECWLFDITSRSWTKIAIPHSVSQRLHHSLSAFVMGPHCVWLVVVGGKDKNKKFITAPNITVLIELNLNGVQWSVVDILDSSLLSTEIYQQKYLQQLKSGRREWLDQYQKPREEETAKLKHTNQALMQDSQQKEKEKQDTVQQLKEKERVIQEKERELQLSRHQLEENQKAKEREIQEKTKALQQSKLTQQQLEEKERTLQQQLQEKERELAESQETVRIYQQQVQSQHNQWLIQKDEVILTEELLGKGAYGHVKVGVFRGLRVAVKYLHDVIISDYNIALFTREMDIASKVRHPNLVQFIGATTVGSPLIVTELMNISLYKVLEKNPLERPQIVSIGRDVALGLNYLHLWKPKPIIHRDVSSPNVLLESSVSAGFFKAKLTDYGTANLQQYTHTKMPGNPVYAAPESLNPSDHSPSMDVYSYCVLLMEMSLHRPPAWTVEERAQQVVLLSWDTMKFLVQSGLNIDHTARPTMAQILNTLNGL